jgi:hypothetical protein
MEPAGNEDANGVSSTIDPKLTIPWVSECDGWPPMIAMDCPMENPTSDDTINWRAPVGASLTK